MIGIIPAAGQAIRFGGILKECLPVGNPYEGGSFLRRAVISLKSNCKDIVVVTMPEKIREHAQQVGNLYGVSFVLQQQSELLGALRSPQLNSEYYFMAMPDTLFPQQAWPEDFDKEKFLVGLFDTTQGQRFGVWRDGQIDDKNPANRGESLKAWGLLGWPWKAMNSIRGSQLHNHTDVFNSLLEQVGYSTFDLDYYYDIADFESYKACLNHTSSD